MIRSEIMMNIKMIEFTRDRIQDVIDFEMMDQSRLT